jgi:hypothetical protein
MTSTRTSTIAIWLATSILAALSCSLYFSAAQLDGEYLPVGNDSFYHARRILDTVENPDAFYEFDSKIHAPEGSLLVWPWGYDYTMAQLVRLGKWLCPGCDPLAILIWIPVAAVFGSMALLVLVARTLGLSTWPTALAALCMALAPTTQFLHGTGQLDHHFAESIMILATIVAGLKWFRQPESSKATLLLASLLGIAPAVHNGMFVLQVPVLFVLAVRWLDGIAPARKQAVLFAVALLATTLAVLIPSTAFRTFRFEFYTLSWFHLYVAFCSAAVAVALSLARRTPKAIAILTLIGLALLVPILAQIEMAGSFVRGTMKWLDTIAEMKSPLREAFTAEGAEIVSQIYSYLIWLAPFTFLLCVVKSWRERRSPRLLFWVSGAAGLVLLSMQVRMHYFGDFALYLPWLIVADDYARNHAAHAKRVFLTTSLALLLCYGPALRQLVAPVPTANDRAFKDTRPMLSVLAQACADDPGTVLADNNAGHYIRYYTDCSVVVNNFLLTPQHLQKMDLAERYFSMGADELARVAPDIKYLLIRPLDIRRADDAKDGYKYWFFYPGRPRLATELLTPPIDQIPREYTLLDEIRFPEADNILYARLYKIQSRPPSQSGVGE